MLFVCPCLNVSVEAILDRPFEETLVDIEYRSGDNENERRFARLVVRSGTAPSAAHDESAIAALQQSPNYSEIYKVLLPPVSAEQQSLGSSFLDDYSFVTNGNSSVTYVHNVASNYLTRERDEMEERIRRFIDEENVRFDEKRVRAKSERALLLQYLAAVGTNTSAAEKRDEGEEEYSDSAISPSPLSLSSTGPSPMSRKAPKAGANNNESAGNDSSNSSGAVQTDSDLYADGTRTKPKRVRHSGGTGKAPKLVSQVDDSQGILFLMDDCDIISAEPQISFDDDGDIDGASTTSEDAMNDHGSLYQTNALNGSSVNGYSSYSPSRGCKALGTSLPVTIPGVTCRTRSLEGSDTDDERSMYHLAASIRMLALTIQEADDPERLFGERPRRRYRRHNRGYENGI